MSARAIIVRQGARAIIVTKPAAPLTGGGGGVTDHGALTGLADDGHTQYALADGSRGTFATAAQGALAATAVQPARTITAAGLATGGGDLSANRTITVTAGTTAGTVCEGNDARLSDARAPTAHNHPLSLVNLGNQAGPTLTLDMQSNSARNRFTATATGNIAIEFANVPSGVQSITLELTAGGDYAVTYSNTVHRPASGEPGLTSATDVLRFETLNGGEAWKLFVEGLGYAPPAVGYDVVLLVGQSNMVGRYGPVDGVLDVTDPAIFQYGFDAEAVALASDPLDHVDENPDNVGLGLSFAKAYLAENPGVPILLVPAADGGTGFGSGYWRDGGDGYENAVLRANAAMTQGEGTNRFVAILWHQGESDASMSESAYAADVDALVNRFRAELTGASSTTPFICGDLVPGWNQPTSNGVRAALENIVDRVAHTAWVDTTGLPDGGDGLHFSAAAQRTLGGLYFTAMANAAANVAAVPDAITDLAATAGDTEVTLGWTAPDANKAPISDYLVEYKAASSGTWLTFADGVSATAAATVTGLTNDAEYDFRVSAMNAVGTGAASNVDSATPVSGGVFAEAGATGHWLLGSDNPTFADLVSGLLLTPAGSGPSLSANYLTTDGWGDGLLSTLDETADMTMCFVVYSPSAATAGIIGGNLTTASGGVGGVSPFFASTELRINERDGFGNLTLEAPRPGNQWIFVACSVSAAGARVLFRGDPVTNVVNSGMAARSMSSPVRALSLGDVHYNDAGFASSVQVAEMIVFSAAKTEAEIDAIYERSRTRMADRGLTIL